MTTLEQVWTNWASGKKFDLTTGKEITMPLPAISPTKLEGKSLEEMVKDEIMQMFNIGSFEFDEKPEYYATRYWEEILV